MAKPADKMVQSGNSRVKVTLNGQVNRAIRMVSTSGENQFQSVDNDGSSSRIVIHAVGQANPNLTIGAHHSLEWQENRRSVTSSSFTGEGNVRLRSRNVELWLAHKNLGTLHLGKGSIAGDAADLLSKSGVGYVFGSAGVGADAVGPNGIQTTYETVSTERDTNAIDPDVKTAAAKSTGRGWRLGSFFGARENRIMYTTPNLMGASASVSYGQNKSFSAGINYAGAPPGVKDFSILFKAGYRQDPNKHNDGAMEPGFVAGAGPDDPKIYRDNGKPMVDTPARTAWGVSGGVEHTASGFSISGGYGALRDKGVSAQPYNWHADLGWKGKVNDMGTTAIGVGYFRSSDGMMGTAQQYWVAINQEIAAAAADVYAGVAFDSGSVTHTTKHVDIGSDGNFVTDATATANYDDAEGDTVDQTCGAVTLTGGAIDAGGPAQGSKCSVKREGVFIFIAGVRIKF